jgi:photosystem II stability/assembly factor-like uncharacterized protein
MKTNTWQTIATLPENGAIAGISGEMGANNLWVCSLEGLFFEKNGVSLHQAGDIPFRSASAVFAIGKSVLAAGYPNYIIYSPDEGRSWFSSRVEPISSAVTRFAASPNFNRDSTLLAGTDGDGILRSTDCGNSWQLSNFGLGSLHILDVVCAPAWDREIASGSVVYHYEIAFAATEGGVYMSPNAGRAWRFSGDGLPAVPVLSMAVSRDFRRSAMHTNARYTGAVFAGTDGAGLYRSRDGGQSWHVVTSLSTGMSINGMVFDTQGTLHLGTSEHGILASPDQGETWIPMLETEDIILCLGMQGTRLLAGTAENGLLALD